MFEQAGAIARITLNRPDAANGMNDTMTRELADAARRCDTDTTKVVVLTGSGRFFSAGGDLKSFASAPSRGGHIKVVADELHRAISTFARMDAVLITSVNGIAAGAGFSLAVTGDLLLAAESASFTMAYTRAGLSPDGSASYYLPRLIGITKTKELMLTNRTLSAQDASRWGLVTDVVADDELADKTDQLANQIAATARKSNGGVKSSFVLNGSALGGLTTVDAATVGVAFAAGVAGILALEDTRQLGSGRGNLRDHHSGRRLSRRGGRCWRGEPGVGCAGGAWRERGGATDGWNGDAPRSAALGPRFEECVRCLSRLRPQTQRPS